MSREQKQAYLQESELFAGLSAREVETIDDRTAMTRCERGRRLFSPQDTPETLYILKEGQVRLARPDASGRMLTVATLERGTIFGESSVLGPHYAGVLAEATEDSLLCVMPAANLRLLMREIPTISLNIVDYLSRQLQDSRDLAERLAFWPVRRRLAFLLVELDERHGHPTLDGNRIINAAIPQHELANLVGSTRETVAEILGKLRNEGVIEMRKRRITILDPERLRELGDG